MVVFESGKLLFIKSLDTSSVKLFPHEPRMRGTHQEGTPKLRPIGPKNRVKSVERWLAYVVHAS